MRTHELTYVAPPPLPVRPAGTLPTASAGRSNRKRHPGLSGVSCVNDGAERYGSLLRSHRQFPMKVHRLRRSVLFLKVRCQPLRKAGLRSFEFDRRSRSACLKPIHSSGGLSSRDAQQDGFSL